ncbi:NADH dehydrogenase FAD-containing subunit [Chromohalobacter marismortui]|uniref:NADH dehydrogenase FAD-containing subunit n=1 Tax=Chromohalobacter marismortui TaxID=42055 RepID=A0A4R7NQ57_9GAMM|nr:MULTISPECIES: FAD-dependent oxidoreductase [Chromohalobacter]MCI0508864.1 FAD-dependent oxidoreductase [Chromohalobacter sp.]MCI0594279.1 FAD-dependent oxidoreductase [Chromohalobacter sp.]TDU22762.1 NADH dehydrogenase FAD-containing subunit [Chromohalobacter marismortui]
MTTHLVLVGAGHAHLHLLTHADTLQRAGYRITLVAPTRFWYSGRAARLLSGAPRDTCSLDIAALATRHGIEHVTAPFVALDVHTKHVFLADGQHIAFDVLSLNVGSDIVPPTASGSTVPTWGDARYWHVKPIERLDALRQHVLDAAQRHRVLRMVVVGGGPSGVEMAANLAGLSQQLGVANDIRLVTRHSRLLPAAPDAAARWASRQLTRLGVEWQPDIAFDDGAEWLDTLDFSPDDIVLATGLRPAYCVADLPLALDDNGIRIKSTLQSEAHATIFAVGDCASLTDSPLPKRGVEGVRQGPVLLKNLMALQNGTPLDAYHPPATALAIVDMHDRGLALYGKHWLGGRLALRLKRYIDRRFLRLYR